MKINAEELTKLQSFAGNLKVKFTDFAILKESLIHKSYSNEQKPLEIPHNERLEFLGDAVLELVVTEYLFSKYPKRPEGELTSFRAALVRKESLAEAAIELDFGDYLYMSRGEEQTGGRTRAYILANAFEAVLGAIYLDLGYDISKDFVLRSLTPKLDHIVANRLDIDAKSRLQELVQDIIRVTPAYQLVGETGPDHAKEFSMGLVIDGRQVATGSGRSKQEAEQSAASSALTNWEQIYKQYFS